MSDMKDAQLGTPDNNGIGGTQVDPILGGVVVERQQHVDELGDLHDRLGPLGAVVGIECFDRGQGVVAVLGVVDLGQRSFRTWVRRRRQGGKNIGADVEPAPLLTGGGERRRSR